MKAFFALLLIPAILAARETPKGWSEWISDGQALRHAGNYPAAIAAFRQALTISETSEKAEEKFIQTLNCLAAVYAQAGQVANAEWAYRRALESLDALQQHQSLAYALLLASLASISLETASKQETADTLRAAIAVYGNEKPPSSSSANLFMIREYLAEILMQKQQYQEAEKLLLDARADLVNQSTPDLIHLSVVLSSLGELRYQQERFEEALGVYLQATQTLRAAVGDAHPKMVSLLDNLALTYFHLGSLNDAEKTLQQAAALCDRFHANDSACGEVYGNYGATLRKLGRKHEAKKWEAEARQLLDEYRHRNGLDSTVSVTELLPH